MITPFYTERADRAKTSARSLGLELEKRAPAINDRREILPEILAQLWELGYYGYLIPKDLGGAGGSVFELVLMLEEIAPRCSSVAISLLIESLAISVLSQDISAERRSKRLARIINERKLLAFALSEPSTRKFETRAEFGDGVYKLTGRKVYVNQAREADWVLVVADSEQGLGVFLVEKGSAGMMTGRDFPRLSARGLSWSEVILEGVKVSPENIIGEPGQGEIYCERALSRTAPLVAAMALGLMDAGLADIAEEEGPARLGGLTGVDQARTGALIELEAGRALCYQTAYGIDKGLEGSECLALAGKIFATEAAFRFLARLSAMAGPAGVAAQGALKEWLELAALLRSLLGANSVLLEGLFE